ncbi:biotin/lipoyl-binding protein [Labilibacter sediminis]|nr:biotin/lipoyl-binding protein [Labilibacter sediminis]
MPLELKINDRIAKVEVLQQDENLYHIKIDNKEYKLDVVKVEASVYSVIYKGNSINLEMIKGDTPNHYKVNTRTDHFQVEVIDPISRYKSSKATELKNTDQVIEAPMPGQIVKLHFSEGDIVQEGDTVVIVSAMKMESEYKAPISGIIKKVHVKEGDTVEGGAPLVEINPHE